MLILLVWGQALEILLYVVLLIIPPFYTSLLMSLKICNVYKTYVPSCLGM